MSPGLTIDILRSMAREIGRIPPAPRLAPSRFWPRDHVGDEVYPYFGSPLYRWVYRFVMRRPVPPTMERGPRIYRDKPMCMNRLTGDVYCSPQQARALEQSGDFTTGPIPWRATVRLPIRGVYGVGSSGT